MQATKHAHLAYVEPVSTGLGSRNRARLDREPIMPKYANIALARHCCLWSFSVLSRSLSFFFNLKYHRSMKIIVRVMYGCRRRTNFLVYTPISDTHTCLDFTIRPYMRRCHIISFNTTHANFPWLASTNLTMTPMLITCLTCL